jgi:hypothetical protein
MSPVSGKKVETTLWSAFWSLLWTIFKVFIFLLVGGTAWYTLKAKDLPTCSGFDCTSETNSLSDDPGSITCSSDPCLASDCCTVHPPACIKPYPSPPTYDLNSVLETDLSIANFNVTGVACDTGYSGIPTATACNTAGEPYTLDGCYEHEPDFSGETVAAGDDGNSEFCMDVLGNGGVDTDDLMLLLASYGNLCTDLPAGVRICPPNSPEGRLVKVNDLLRLLGQFGSQGCEQTCNSSLDGYSSMDITVSGTSDPCTLEKCEATLACDGVEYSSQCTQGIWSLPAELTSCINNKAGGGGTGGG